MPIGVIVNALAVFLGGLFGSGFGKILEDELKRKVTLVLGVCSMGMGIYGIVQMKNMPAVILSIVVGTTIGVCIKLEKWIQKGALFLEKPITVITKNKKRDVSQEEFLSTFVTILVLFCASGTGIYGALDSGMTGDHSILLSKSVLDFFTASIFSCTLGLVVCSAAIPQFVLFLLLFYFAKLIFPMTTPNMIADFKACGGFLMLATGFRMVKIKEFPIADMIPAMVLVMPLSYLWSHFVMPFL